MLRWLAWRPRRGQCRFNCTGETDMAEQNNPDPDGGGGTSPLKLYREAVKSVPQLRWALAAVVVVGLGTQALFFAKEQPQTAVMSFVLMLAAMFMLVLFAGFEVRDPVMRIVRRAIVIALSIIFLLAMAMTLSAYAIGKPCHWAEFVKAKPECVAVERPMTLQVSLGRNETTAATTAVSQILPVDASAPEQSGSQRAQSPPIHESGAADRPPVVPKEPGHAHTSSTPTSSAETAQVPSAASSVAPAGSVAIAATAPPLPPATSTEVWHIDQGSDDCAADSHLTVTRCTGASSVTIASWEGPILTSANCGSSITNLRRTSDTCMAADVNVHGCGYDNFLLARNCRGRGWVVGDIRVLVSGR